jgi:DNA polymerase III, beta subunit
MQLKIQRKELLSALNKVNRAVSSNSPIPILSGIKFDATKTSLTLTGSDSNITIKTIILKQEDLLEVIETGSVVLSSRLITEIIRKLESDFVTLEIIDGILTKIKGDDSTFNLNGFNAIEYPNIDLKESGEHFKINSIILKNIIAQTSFASSKKEIKPIFTGVNFVADEGVLSTTATDSYRLAKKVINLDQNIRFNITIPAKSLTEISNILEKDEDINLYVSDRKILLTSSDVTLQTRLIDGNFPDVNRLIPTTYDYDLKINSKDLLNAIDRASLLATDANHNVKLTMNQNEIVISSNSQEIGSVKEKITAAEFIGEPLSISFSARYVSEAVKSINATLINIYFNGDMKPFVIKDKKDESITQLLLPVKTY